MTESTPPHTPQHYIHNVSADDRPSLRARNNLATSLTWGAIFGLGYLVYNSPRSFDTTYLLGLSIAILAIYPTVHWARTMTHRYPVFEILIATHLTTYAIPIISGRGQERIFASEVEMQSAIAVVVFLLLAYAGFYLTRFRPKHSRFWTENLFRDFRVELLSTALAITTVYVVVVAFFWFPPGGLAGILRAVAFGITTTAIFLLSMQWGRGELPHRDKGILAVCVTIQFLVLASSLILRTGASLVLLTVIGYFFGARRIPWVAFGAIFLVLALLHNGKNHMRSIYWFDDNPVQVSLTSLPGFYEQWASAGLQSSEDTGQETSSLLERSSLIQMLCLVIEETPTKRPFLNGETYGHILGQFVPRILWPDKPRGHVSTYRLAIYYGLQDEDATSRTTIAFGMLPEAYANYGMMGIAGLGFVLGLLLKVFLSWSQHSPMFSPAGLLIILLTAWSFQTELTLSAWLGSLFQASVSLMGMLILLKRIL